MKRKKKEKANTDEINDSSGDYNFGRQRKQNFLRICNTILWGCLKLPLNSSL